MSLENHVAVDKGALKLATMALERAGKNEIAEELLKSCVSMDEVECVFWREGCVT